MKIVLSLQSVLRQARLLRGVLLAGAGLLALPACDSGRGSSAPGRGPGAAPLPARSVRTARVAERRVERVVVVLGSLRAREQAALSTKVSGRVRTLKVDLGSRVKRGDVVAILDARDYELKVQQAAAALAQARAALGLPVAGDNDEVDLERVSSVKEARAVLAEAKANFDRITRLAQEKLVSSAEADVAQSAYLVALNRYEDAQTKARQQTALVAQRRAELEIAKQQLADTTIVAPFDGGIQARQADVGEYLSVGTPVVTLVQLDPLRLRMEIPERYAAQVRLGQTVRLTLEGDTHVYTGTLDRLSPALDELNRMLIAEADIRNEGRLHPGSFARTEIVTVPDARALVIPIRALSVFAGLQKAIAVQDGQAVEKRITTGQQGPDWVEVLSGLKRDEDVVLDPGNLQTGQPVAVESGGK